VSLMKIHSARYTAPQATTRRPWWKKLDIMMGFQALKNGASIGTPWFARQHYATKPRLSRRNRPWRHFPPGANQCCQRAALQIC
jgi:hypothetical protein